jgi:serine/threonine protein kinase/tetratricopeptide (TPR) repeat protein
MNPERWRRAEELFHAALERSPDERRAFLDQACGEDDALRRLVVTLVSKDEQAGGFLEDPAFADATGAQGVRGSLVGRQFGPYRIVSFLGGGGMGEVYRAHDGKLGRDVAIKTLPPEFARDPERLARFRREARALASLNHPNIAAIYGLEETADAHYLVLELVEGDTLRGPLPLVTALDFAGQVVEALEAAHRQGIVHRDLKPANLKVTPEGRVKVLDFGLAKAIRETDAIPDLARPMAVIGEATATGRILGTPGYMSPEQAQGSEVDQRADIWAFGCVLYELLAGKRAFGGETASDTITAVLEHEPEWQALPGDTPAMIRDLLRQCLHKDASRRLNDIADAGSTLQEGRRVPSHRGPRQVGTRIHSLAVLPLTNLARDPEEDYFADGMTEALIAELAQIHALRVISRTSSMHYKTTTKTVPEIARELAVDGIVEGSVMRAGDRVRINAQLIHAASDRHVWAQSYEREARDVLHLQSEVARAIADEIEVTLTPEERARLTRARPVNLEAHEAYIRGRYDWGRAHLDSSIEHFERAIAMDPDYALAYAGIADARCRMFGAALELVPPSQVAPLVRAAAVKALELDESLAEPHVSLSRVLFWHDRDPVGAERELRRAIQLNSSCAMAHFIHGLLLADLERTDEAMAALQRALRLDPVSSWNSAIAGFFMCELGQEDVGRRQLAKSIELDETFFLPWSLLSVVDCGAGKLSEAAAEAEEGLRLSSGLPMARGYAAYALAMAGRPSEAITMLDQLEVLSRLRYVPPIARAWCYLGLRDYERTLAWLEIGFEQRDSQLPHLRLMRAFEPLHADARFQELLRQQGLAPERSPRAQES